VEEELERRKDEIESEVLRRIEEAKRVMEQQMLADIEAKRLAELEAQKAIEVNINSRCRVVAVFFTSLISQLPPLPVVAMPTTVLSSELVIRLTWWLKDCKDELI